MTILKKLTLIIFLMVTFSIAKAQRFDAGVLAGFNGSQVNGDTYEGYNKPGLLGGLFVRTELAPAVFAGMEIKYSQKGARNRITPKDPEPKKYIMRLGYADIPVYIGFRTSDLISIIGGVSAGYLVHGAEYNEYGKFPPEEQVKFNEFDVQAFLGLQSDILDQVVLDLRFCYSVLPIRGKPGGSELYYWRESQFNNVISLALYYRFNRY